MKNKISIFTGKKLELIRVFTENEVKLYALLTGDNNPIHLDEKFSQNTRFKTRICHGMLIGALFSTIIGTNFPMAIYLKQNLQFMSPVFLNEEIKSTVLIKEITKKVILLETNVLKILENKIAIQGEATILIDNISDYDIIKQNQNI